MSPMNSSRIGCASLRRIEIDDAAAHAELAVLVDGILRREAGEREPLAEILRRDLVAGRERQAGVREPAGIGQPRQQRARGRDDEPRRSRREARAARARARTPPRGEAPGRGTDRLPATETAGPRARRRRRRQSLRGSPGRTGRRPSSARRRRRSARRAAPARPARATAAWNATAAARQAGQRRRRATVRPGRGRPRT